MYAFIVPSDSELAFCLFLHWDLFLHNVASSKKYVKSPSLQEIFCKGFSTWMIFQYCLEFFLRKLFYVQLVINSFSSIFISNFRSYKHILERHLNVFLPFFIFTFIYLFFYLFIYSIWCTFCSRLLFLLLHAIYIYIYIYIQIIFEI